MKNLKLKISTVTVFILKIRERHLFGKFGIRGSALSLKSTKTLSQQPLKNYDEKLMNC
jgi:hypothetical protein